MKRYIKFSKEIIQFLMTFENSLNK